MALSDCSRMQLDMLKRFPLLVPTSINFTSYEGFLEVDGFLFSVSMIVPNYPSCQGIALNCEWKLLELLSNHKDTLADWSRSEKSLTSFLEGLCSLIINCLENEGSSLLSLEKDTDIFEEQLDNLLRQSAILSELKELGTTNLESISGDFGNISLSSVDTNGDSHRLNLKLANDDNVTIAKQYFEVIDTDLPEKIIKMIQKETSLTRAFKTFSEQIGILIHIWDSLTLIDKECWVIDPIYPRRADMYRRIFISPPRVMAQLSWDPLRPNQPPEIKFQGADSEVDVLRATYEKHVEDWDQDCCILDNLCSVLQLAKLPKAPPPETNVASQTVETGECSFCYTVLLEGKLPEVSCGKCLSSFHAECLYEWLEILPGCRPVHGHVSGPCPNCGTVIRCPCPHALS